MNYQAQTTCVFPSPSKIPYGGFSPVRLQTEIQPPPSSTRPGLSAARMLPETRLISGYRPGSQRLRPTKGLTVGEAATSASSGTAARRTGRFRPEALGSPTGYSVPPDHRLLWPHPSLSVPPTDLLVRRWVLFVHRPGSNRNREVPQFTPCFATFVPSSVPRWTGRVPMAVLPRPHWPSPTLQGLGVHKSTPSVLVWLRNEAARFA
jgi:hypothetical protein